MPRPHLNYKQALVWLYGLQRFGIKLGLENTRRLLDEYCSGVRRGERPALAAVSDSRPKVIHVAGTNGKGSVCAMIDSICRAQGYRTGLFISPHLVTFRERIRVNGEMISRGRCCRRPNDNKGSGRGLGPAPDVFRSHNRARAKTFWRRENRYRDS